MFRRSSCVQFLLCWSILCSDSSLCSLSSVQYSCVQSDLCSPSLQSVLFLLYSFSPVLCFSLVQFILCSVSHVFCLSCFLSLLCSVPPVFCLSCVLSLLFLSLLCSVSPVFCLSCVLSLLSSVSPVFSLYSPAFCLFCALFILSSFLCVESLQCSDAPVLVAALQEVVKEDDMSALLSCTVKGEPWPQVNSQIKLLLFL